MNMGFTKPIPAIAAWPSPTIHTPSMILYDAVRSIESIMGMASFLIAVSGSPLQFHVLVAVLCHVQLQSCYFSAM
jgi:hypothetical protein